MDPEQISRLREEQLKAIEQTNSRIIQLEAFKEDYVALRDKLMTLPNKVKHDVMVPFGDLAFMPGQLVHTNEILVLLGDNWFVDRSASQAANIVNRRIQAIDGQVKELDEQKGLLKPRLEYTSELTDIAEGRQDVKDIREDYDENKEKLWRENHRKSVQKYHKQLRERKEAVVKYNSSEKQEKPKTDEELWARLDELELKERQGNEMLKINDNGEEELSTESESEESSESDEGDDASKKKVRWKDSGGDNRPKRNIITFSHSPTDQQSVQKSTDEIMSPGDIYKHFVPEAAPTSILKSTSRKFPVTEPVKENRQHEVVHTTADAFTGSIVERQAAQESATHTETRGAQKVSQFKAARTSQNTRDTTVEPEQSSKQQENNPKKISKFKAQRQQMQR